MTPKHGQRHGRSAVAGLLVGDLTGGHVSLELQMLPRWIAAVGTHPHRRRQRVISRLAGYCARGSTVVDSIHRLLLLWVARTRNYRTRSSRTQALKGRSKVQPRLVQVSGFVG